MGQVGTPKTVPIGYPAPPLTGEFRSKKPRFRAGLFQFLMGQLAWSSSFAAMFCAAGLSVSISSSALASLKPAGVYRSQNDPPVQALIDAAAKNSEKFIVRRICNLSAGLVALHESAPAGTSFFRVLCPAAPEPAPQQGCDGQRGYRENVTHETSHRLRCW